MRCTTCNRIIKDRPVKTQFFGDVVICQCGEIYGTEVPEDLQKKED